MALNISMPAAEVIPGSDRIVTRSDNNPPTEAELLRQHLNDTQAALLEEKQRLLALADELPRTWEDEETQFKAQNLVRDTTAALKKTEVTRVAVKEPFLKAERTIDGWANALKDPLRTMKTWVEDGVGKYLRAKADAAREAARKLADEQRRESERLQREALEREQQELAEREAPGSAETPPLPLAVETAQRLPSTAHAGPAAGHPLSPPVLPSASSLMHQATESEQIANAAHKRAQAKPSDLARTRSEEGALGTLQTVWDFEIVAPMLVPRVYCKVDDTLIRSAVREAVRTKTVEQLRIPGVRIYSQQKARVI